VREAGGVKRNAAAVETASKNFYVEAEESTGAFERRDTVAPTRAAHILVRAIGSRADIP